MEIILELGVPIFPVELDLPGPTGETLVFYKLRCIVTMLLYTTLTLYFSPLSHLAPLLAELYIHVFP